MKPSEETALKSFIIAVSQLDTSPELQESIHEIGKNLTETDTNIINKIPSLVNQDETLKQLYEDAYKTLEIKSPNQEKDKGELILSDTLTLTNIAQKVLTADDFKSIGRKILNNLKKNTDAFNTDAFIRTWQVELTFSEAREKVLIDSILNALENHSLTIEDLYYHLNIFQQKENEKGKEKLMKIMQRLWDEKKIDTLTGGMLRKIFPVLRKDSKFNPDAYFTITSIGYFSLHPIIKVG